MQSRHADAPDFAIRPLETSAERDAYTILAIQTFSPHVDAATALPQRRRFVENNPAFQPHQLRGAFLGNTLLGGCHIDVRTLCIGSARLLTACIGGVVTVTEHRKQGVAAALLQDAVHYAQQQNHALLLLDGIADFYHRFGFIDVFDNVYHTIDSKTIQAQPRSPYMVRQATFEDIPALFELYQKHYSSHAGSFERDLAFQERLFHERGGIKPYLAVDKKGTVQGYLLLNTRPEKLVAYEAAANDWHAALALLQQHVTLIVERSGDESSVEVSWPLPTDSATFYLLSDHLSLRSQVTRTPNADWMARTAHMPTLIEALLPLWNERWQRYNVGRSGVLAVAIENESFLLGSDGVGIHLLDPMTSSAHAARQVTMTQQVFTQLLFGYRPVSWAAKQPGQVIPEDLHSLLDILFAETQAWIAGSDAF